MDCVDWSLCDWFLRQVPKTSIPDLSAVLPGILWVSYARSSRNVTTLEQARCELPVFMMTLQSQRKRTREFPGVRLQREEVQGRTRIEEDSKRGSRRSRQADMGTSNV